MSESGGGDLFIVDNSVSGWTGLEYLRQWSDLARSFDIATGFFEIGALLALDGKWQQLDKIRLLMGDEVSLQTHKVFKEALRQRVGRLDESLEHEKNPNPFLEGVEAVVEAIAEGRIECRVYRRDKFHAKAYITHAKFDVVGAQALVGSSNFTKPGLTRNVELNIQVQSGRDVAQLQDWFETHWAAAEDVTADVLRAITRHTAEFTPFDVYARALHEFFRGRELTAGEWDESQSRMFGQLDRYQQEAYWSMMKISRQHSGAFLCDGVGLGKTFVGLMLIERLVLHENKRVVLFAPKAAREGVWEPHLRRWLPHIGGVGGGADFSSLSVFSHTDLGRGNDFPERFRRITDLADAVIVDEAHHFRNRGSRGDDTPDGGRGLSGRIGPGDDGQDRRSRYWRLFDMLDGSVRPKLMFLLTATPVNNRLADFRHMAELFTRGDEAFFARSLGVNNLSGHFNVMERALQSALGRSDGEAPDTVGSAFAEGMTPEAQEALAADEDDADEDVIPPELLDAVTELSRGDYDVAAILDKTFEDLDEIARFLDAASRLTPEQDDKVRKLVRLLRTKDLAGRKVLVFTEFADTARYVESHLRAAGVDGLVRIDSGSKVDRAEVIRRFSPYYNASSTAELAADGLDEIRVLVSTDVLSEGLNLQDATRLVNYDLHWNPVRLMQRIGRVDRRMSPDVEQRLAVDHPETAAERGTVRFWNFLPPDELERILELYEKVAGKTLLISHTLGIEGRKLLRPDDAYDPLREFNASYEGTRTAAEEMHLEYQALLKRHPDLAERLDGLPGSVFSGRRKLAEGIRGVFFCYSLPALDAETGAFTLEAGPTRWYLYDVDDGSIVESPGDIVGSIRSKPNTPRRCTTERATLKQVRDKILRRVRDTYLKRVNAPMDAPEPKLRCWMELN